MNDELLKIDYVGLHYTNKPDFKVMLPSGTPHYFLSLFLTDIYFLHEKELLFFPAGTAILYKPFSRQHYFNEKNGFSNDWFQFTGKNLDDFLDKIDFPLDTPFKINNIEFVHQKITELEHNFFIRDDFSDEILDLLAKEILIHLKREYKHQLLDEDMIQLENRLRDVKNTVLSQLDKDWTLKSMADLAGLSPSRFSHVYKSIFHVSPKKNLQLERINKAKFLIQSQNYSVSEAAASVGYENIFHFSKQFKTVTGKAPSEYNI